MCFTPFSFKNCVNSADTNCGPLSLTSCCGRLYVEKILLNSVMTLADVVEVNWIISGHSHSQLPET